MRYVLIVILLFSITVALVVVQNAAENAPKAPEEGDELPPNNVRTPPMASTTRNPKIPEIHLNFAQAFIKTFFIIVISEIGDKTFFIAAIMAMKHPRMMVFFGAISALALMTVISVLCGWAFSIIPKMYTYYGSVILFLAFGLKMIYDGLKMSPNEAQEEYDEVQAELRKREEEHAKRLKKFAKPRKEDVPPVAETDTAVTVPDGINEYDGNSVVGVNGSLNGTSTSLRTASTERRQNEASQFEKEILTKDVETGGYMSKNSKRRIFQMLSHIIVQAFTLTFLAEWGDRSQISTMALAIKDDKLGITVGGIAGHSICTGLAVIGGRFIAQKISVKTVTIVGGFVFIIFALITLFLESSETPGM